MDSIWGDILVHRQALQTACSNFIAAHPALANNIAADKYLWHISYYDAIVECRKRLRLHTPLSNLSSLTTDSDSISNDGSYAQSNRTSISDGPLEEWQRDWWSLTLQTLFKEALGFFQELLGLVAENLEMTSLEYALYVLNRPPGGRVPPVFAIARRLFICLGDVYRYQYMYLPLLHCSGMGLVDAENILDLARWTYARARALYTDSGRACVQLALLSAYANNRFDTVFWELCSLCYDGGRAMSRSSSRRGLLYVDNPATDNDSCSEDPIEQAVVELARAIHSSQNTETVLALYSQALVLLETDIAEIRDGDSLELDTDFWAREYQLSVVLAALLTLATNNPIIDTKTKHTYLACIQHLAIVLLLRQMHFLQQTPRLISGWHEGLVYPLCSIALWMDIWRSCTYLRMCQEQNDWQWDFDSHSADLFSSLAELVGKESDIKLTQNAVRMALLANEALPHDVSLLGWISLRNVQRNVHYGTILGDQLEGFVAPEVPHESRDLALLGIWNNPTNIIHVVAARIQLLLLAATDQRLFKFMTWDQNGELKIATSSPLIGAPLKSPSEDQAGMENAISDPAPPLPLRIPDTDAWLSALPLLQKWSVAHSCTLVIAESIKRQLEAAHSRHPALQFIASNIDNSNIIEHAEQDSLEWSNANQYLYGLQVDETMSIDEDELPTAEEVPDYMRDLLQCALYFAYVKYPKCDIAIVSDSEELAFYASWFDLRCINPSEP
ncbi:hypothetical protein EV183_000474 [Coemansia sp. RSA 2336]|nr:hypothetical protein EV183_000474 [Coemansia sp. RSA 2336]